MSIVTRFAPSPTGFLHIGGARTALFNYLFARRMGGRYLLRIEDTDQQRSDPAARAAILDGLTWLDLMPDGQVVYQSERAGRHCEVAQAMVASGAAYRCYVSAQELASRRDLVEQLRAQLHAAEATNEAPAKLESLRDQVKRASRAFRSPYRHGKLPAPKDQPFVVRLKVSETGNTVVADRVQGEVSFNHAEMDDLILLRSDGTPTYMLAVVVDDYDMGVTHIIRGVDHLTNAGRQLQIIRALGWPDPVYAHVPLIHGPDGAKLSKRHGALAVQAYREMGYLPDALCNYLLRLGWSHGDAEIVNRAEATGFFGLEGLGKSPAQLDFAKMDAVNAHYLKEKSTTELLPLIEKIAKTNNHISQNMPEVARAEIWNRALPTLQKRSKNLVELLKDSEFLWVAPSNNKPLAPDQLAILGRFSEILAGAQWTVPHLESAIRDFAAHEKIGLGKIGPLVRQALTGGLPAPDLANMIFGIGQSESTRRLAVALQA